MLRLGAVVLMCHTRHTTKLQQVQSAKRAALGVVRALKQQVEVLTLQVVGSCGTDGQETTCHVQSDVE